MNIKQKLEQIVSKERVSDELKDLEVYSKDFSLADPRMPNYVVRAKSTSEVQNIVSLANEEKIPVIPVSSSVHFYGATIPHQGGIVLDLTRMNKIIEIDEINRKARIEPGVTWGQLQNELSKKGLFSLIPLLPHSSRSVVSDYLEREVPLIPIFEIAEPILSMEIVWPNGEIFRTGSASVPNFPDTFAEGANPLGPGSMDFGRLPQGAQGTMGIVTWMNVKIEYLPTLDKVFFMTFTSLKDAVEPLYRIQRLKIGNECFLVNNQNYSLLLGSDNTDDLNELKNTLCQWTFVIVLSGLKRRPEEKIAYEEKALREVCKEFPGLELLSSLPGLGGIERKLPQLLRKPWSSDASYWKNRLKGTCHSIFFITKPEKTPAFVDTIREIAGRHEYPANDIGCYLQPIDNARACHLEFNFFYNRENLEELERIKALDMEAVKILLSQDAYFTRPYGIISDYVYNKAYDYTMVLKTVKNIFDPNNILCPGNLCF
ncbi:MAG: FAD-binding oxidoreductase [Thermodesulfobacteriota bacterium]|nr:FAD-binding oxidoreductase [Thermodesulfobacteriota bacterium]